MTMIEWILIGIVAVLALIVILLLLALKGLGDAAGGMLEGLLGGLTRIEPPKRKRRWVWFE